MELICAALAISMTRCRGGIRPEAVTDPQQFPPAIKQSIACSFKRNVLRPVQNFKSIFREPGAVMRLFTLSFNAAKLVGSILTCWTPGVAIVRIER
jgi:hypothetical protein